MDVQAIEKRRVKIDTSDEWQTFTTLIQSVRELFNPDAATLRIQAQKGAKLHKRRIADIGTLFKNDYTAGIVSEMITSGDQWFEYYVNDATQDEYDILGKLTELTMDSINHSNFVSEFALAVASSCEDGTVCQYSERYTGEEKIRDSAVPFGNFWFARDYYGEADTVWIKKTTTAGALVERFGLKNVSENCKNKFEENPDQDIDIICYCAKREERDALKKDIDNKKYVVLTYEMGDEAHLLEKGGSDYQKFAVYAVRRSRTESLGRGPCIDAVCTMAEIEEGMKAIRRAVTINTVPFLGVPASQGQNAYKIIDEKDAYFRILLYKDVGISGHPPHQIISQAKVEDGESWIKYLSDTMRQLFFLDYFNPLQDRRNMTASEMRERVQKSHQMVSQIVTPLENDLLNKLLQMRFYQLAEAGKFEDFGSKDELLEQFGGRLKIRYKSRLSNAQKRIRLLAEREALGFLVEFSQGLPAPEMQVELMASIDTIKLPKEIFEGTNAPMEMLRKRTDVKKIVNDYKASAARQAEMENAVRLADAASKGGGTPGQGSLTQRALDGQL